MSDSNRRAVRDETQQQIVPPAERRQSTRYRLRDARVVMSWSEGSEQVASDGEVLNISGGGAAVLAERLPSAGLSVRLQLERRLAAIEPFEARDAGSLGRPFRQAIGPTSIHALGLTRRDP